MKDRIRYIPSIIMLVAGLVACIVTFINHYKPLESMITILVTIVVFYCVGCIVKAVFNKCLIVEDETEEATEEEEPSEDGETSSEADLEERAEDYETDNQ